MKKSVYLVVKRQVFRLGKGGSGNINHQSTYK